MSSAVGTSMCEWTIDRCCRGQKCIWVGGEKEAKFEEIYHTSWCLWPEMRKKGRFFFLFAGSSSFALKWEVGFDGSLSSSMKMKFMALYWVIYWKGEQGALLWNILISAWPIKNKVEVNCNAIIAQGVPKLENGTKEGASVGEEQRKQGVEWVTLGCLI